MEERQMANAKITGLGHYIPEKIYDNAYMESIVETNDEWITRRTGIKERHITEDNEYTTDIAAEAAKRAIADAKLTPEDIDLIILATVTPDYFTPSCACVVQGKIGAVNAMAFDYNAACSGFVVGVIMADQFIKSGVYKNVLVVSADTLSKATDYKDRATCVLFGDAAGAAVISATDEPGLISFDMGADGTGAESITSLAYRNDAEELEKRIGGRKDTIWMAGQAVMKFAVKAMADSSQRALDRAGLTYDDIALVVPHQANYRIVDSAIKRMGISNDKVILTIQKYGNTSASCIPVALHEAVETGRVKKGDKIVLVGFGGGLTYAACVIQL
jgi:3-oxoacyl-[acyl-carrier-protein] synthase-3